MIVGIDNGINGGLCAISAFNGAVISYTVMPTYERKGKTEIDTVGVRNWISDLHTEPRIVIEEPLRHAKSSQAVRSMAISFGKLYGLCEVKGWEVLDVEVRDWQKKMIPGAQKGQTKVVAAKVAEELSGVKFLKSNRSKVSHDGIVDAYLIAFYALQIERDV